MLPKICKFIQNVFDHSVGLAAGPKIIKNLDFKNGTIYYDKI